MPQVWDTNTAEQVTEFPFHSRVHTLAMSPLATTHTLVAVGSSDPLVRLCDIATGGFTHTLTGHREGVWAVAWAEGEEFTLVTGGCDGQARTPVAAHIQCLSAKPAFQALFERKNANAQRAV